jgi:hypothetical protein
MGAQLDTGYTSRHATYDLRRLRRKQLIERLPGTRRYQLTARGRSVAELFTKTYGRVLGPGLVALNLSLPADLAKRSPWLPPGATSTAPWTPSSITGWPPRDAET